MRKTAYGRQRFFGPPHRGSIACLIAVVVSSAGCSFAFVETLPDKHPQLPYFDCTSTPGLAVADGVFSLSSAVMAHMALSNSKEEYADKFDGGPRDLAAGIYIGAGAIFLASGIYGLVQSARCSSAKGDLRQRLLGQEDDALPESVVERDARPMAPQTLRSEAPSAEPAVEGEPEPVAPPASPEDSEATPGAVESEAEPEPEAEAESIAP
jgi:hypothetical protein